MKNFAIIGVGGYIAPRHIQAIKDVGGRLVAAMDINDSVGILDRYSLNTHFFTSFEKFESYIEGLVGTADQIDYVSVCSPNHLHAPHIHFALRMGANCICEKPIALTTQEIDNLISLQKKYDRQIFTILQLRHHPKIIELKEKTLENSTNFSTDKDEVSLTYITTRGPWYQASWKGDINKSGGIATNIGVHFFDLLTWLYGTVKNVELYTANATTQSGYLEFDRARVKWHLSIDQNNLPEIARQANKTTYRSITINNKEIEFSDGFTDLHTEIYKNTIAGFGFGLEDSRPAIEVTERIRNMHPQPTKSPPPIYQINI